MARPGYERVSDVKDDSDVTEGASAASGAARKRRPRKVKSLSQLEREVLEKRKRAEERERVRNKVEGLLWVVVSAFILWYGDGKRNFVAVVATDERIARNWLAACGVSFALNTCIYLYLTIWLGAVKGSKEDWNISSPYAIPAGTVLGIFTFFSFTIAVWPVWFLLSPLVAFALLLGFVGSWSAVAWALGWLRGSWSGGRKAIKARSSG
ncbi:hypothetical protein HOP50_03g21130 [Chloropicon primus]|nr:hypothetical protein HOP50_03g21130 [Chloropicon primus]